MRAKHTAAMLVLAVSLATACGQELEEAPQAESQPADYVVPEGLSLVTRDSAGVSVVEISGDFDRLPEWVLADAPIVTVSGAVEPYLSRVGEVEWLSDGRLVVEDNQHRSLYLFGADGTLSDTLGMSGQGPGEYRNITETTVGDADTLFVYDRVLDRLSTVHPDLGFLESVRLEALEGAGSLPPVDAWGLGSDRVLTQHLVTAEGSGAMPWRLDQTASFVLSDGRGGVLSGVVTQPGPYIVQSATSGGEGLYASNPAVDAASNRIAYTGGVGYTVTVTGPDFVPQRIVRWSGWEGPIPEEELGRLHAWLDGLDWPNDHRERMREAWLSPHLLPDTRPVFDRRAFLGPEGSLWLGQFVPAAISDVEATWWHRLDEQGRPLGRVLVPAGWSVVAARGSTLVLLGAGALDVPMIEIRAVEAAGG